jgi:crotonobetainyl-CoA:carnitine CoA-transferase CaiB-like acyl-CoA transferase
MGSSLAAGVQPFRFQDGWGVVAPTGDADFAGMCRAFDVEGYDDPRVATIAQRRNHRDVSKVLMDRCHAKAAQLTKQEATRRLEAQRVPFSMILSPDEIVDDPHAVAVGMFEERDHHVTGRTRLPRHPALFGATPAALASAAPALGEHSDAILAELGLAERTAEMRAKGVVH